MAQSVPPGDIKTNKVFSGPLGGKHTFPIKITNSSARRIGWAIKTTNMKRLSVDPGSGVLDPKETVAVLASYEGSGGYSIIVEWTNTPDGAAKQFRREWFQGDGMVRSEKVFSFNCR